MLPTSKFKNIVAYEENWSIIKAFFDEENPKERINKYSKYPRQIMQNQKQMKQFKEQLLDALQTFEAQNWIYLSNDYKWQKKNWW